MLAIIDQQQQHIQRLEETVGNLRDEIALLKGEKPRPKIAPSRLQAPPPKPPPASGDKRPGSSKRAKTASFLNPVLVKIPYPEPPLGSTSNTWPRTFAAPFFVAASADGRRFSTVAF